MRVENAFLSNLGISLPGSSPEQDDSSLRLPNIVLATLEPIAPILKLIGSGGTSDASGISAIQLNKNNICAATFVHYTLTKGLYEINVGLFAKFSWTQPNGGSPILSIGLTDPTASVNPLVAMFAQTNTQSLTRTFRILTPNNGWTITVNHGAVGVAEFIDAMSSVVLTKIL